MNAHSELASTTWACEARALEAFLRAVAEARARPLVASMRFEDTQSRLEVRGDTAIIPVRGVLTRGGADPWARFFGIETTGYDEIREAMQMALLDPSVSRMVMAIDSPGGDAIGLSSLWQELRDAGAKKPLLASISGQGASAAYYLATAAEEIISEPDAMVGSIGAFAIVLDSSEMAGKLGIKVHVLRSGPHKGMGTPGASVSEEQLAGAQEVIDDLAAGFVRAVAEGRRMKFAQAQELATGAVWVAARALPLGLVDRVGTLADVLAGEAGTEVKMLKKNTEPRSMEDDEDEDEDEEKEKEKEKAEEKEKEKEKAEENDDDEDEDEDDEDDESKAATLSQLERILSGHPDLIVSSLKAGHSPARARNALLSHQLTEARASLAKAEARQRAGIDPRAFSTRGTSEGEPEAGDYMAACRALAAKRGIPLRAAQREIVRTQPRLYEEYVHELRIRGGARPVKSWGSSTPAKFPARA